VLPHALLDRRRPQAAPWTCPGHMARIAQGTDVAPAQGTPGAYHPPAAAPTDEETAQQIAPGRRMALGACLVLP
jgi:hypothetical protein